MMKPKFYPLLERCIEDGLAFGWVRAHKHDDNPDPQHIQNAQYEAVINELHAWFKFEQGDDIE